MKRSGSAEGGGSDDDIGCRTTGGGAWNGAGCPIFFTPVAFAWAHSHSPQAQAQAALARGRTPRAPEPPAPPTPSQPPANAAQPASQPAHAAQAPAARQRGPARSTLTRYPSVAVTLITPKTPPRPGSKAVRAHTHARYSHMRWCDNACRPAPHTRSQARNAALAASTAACGVVSGRSVRVSHRTTVRAAGGGGGRGGRSAQGDLRLTVARGSWLMTLGRERNVRQKSAARGSCCRVIARGQVTEASKPRSPRNHHAASSLTGARPRGLRLRDDDVTIFRALAWRQPSSTFQLHSGIGGFALPSTPHVLHSWRRPPAAIGPCPWDPWPFRATA